MALNPDTDRTQAVHVKHISHRWLRWLDEKVGSLQHENGGFFDLFVTFRGRAMPLETDMTGKYRSTHLFEEREG